MTSATDELRRLLDEHDEYYKTSGNKTWWGRPIDRQTGKPINVFHYQAQPMGEDRLLIELQLATPAQAIAATLGATDAKPTQVESSGTCHMVLREDIYGHAYQDNYECSECGEYVVRETYMGESEPPNYCPNCGRKVVDE